jgi:Ser/Thr protein kinase RdoA (MazF antagonist)
MPDAASVMAAFGLNGQYVEMAPVGGAWSNRVFRLSTGSARYAVKQLRNPWAEPRWLERLNAAWEFELQALGAGVRMPEPIANPADGGCVAWVETVHGTNTVPVRLHAWMDGSAPGPDPVDASVAWWAGETLAILHNLERRVADRSLFPVPNTHTADAWPELVAAARSADVVWWRELEALTPDVARIADLVRQAVAEEREESMCHGDIDQKNIVVAADGPVLCDWDVAMPLVPRHELADVAVSLASWDRPDVAREVVRAYKRDAGEDLTLLPHDLGPSMSNGLDWLAFNVERAIGVRRASDDEVALSRRLVPELIADTPRQVDVALRLPEFLDGLPNLSS